MNASINTGQHVFVGTLAEHEKMAPATCSSCGAREFKVNPTGKVATCTYCGTSYPLK